MADYEVLAEQYFVESREHFGIIVSPRRSFREIFHRLLKLLEECDEMDLKNQIYYL